MTDVDIGQGSILGGDFVLEQHLADGGMGSVWIARQRSTGVLRAVKVMLPEIVRAPAASQRFLQEAQIGSRIESDHIVQVVAAGIDAASGTPWLAMELLKGADLEAHLAEHGPFEPAEAAIVLAQVCHALAAAHAAGVVHRDLKPANVFLAQSRRVGVPFTVKILDFGVAKILSEAAGTSMTRGIGTPLYMPPEQTGASTSIGPHSDVWSLGLLAFELLVGRSYWHAAYEKSGFMTFMRELTIDPLPPASEAAARHGAADRLPPGFDDWFETCVNRDVRGRFATAGAACAALERVLPSASELSHAASFVPPQPRRAPAATPPQAVSAVSVEPERASLPAPPPAGMRADLGEAALRVRWEEHVRRGQMDRAYCIASLLVYAGHANREEKALYQQRQSTPPVFRAAITREQRERLFAYERRDPLLVALLDALAPIAQRAAVAAQRQNGDPMTAPESVLRGDDLAANAFGRVLFGVGKLLTLAPPPLVLRDDLPGRLRAYCSDPPVIIACKGALAASSKREMQFLAARQLMMLREAPALLMTHDATAITQLVLAAIGLGGPTTPTAGVDPVGVEHHKQALASVLMPREVSRLSSAVRAFAAAGGPADVGAWIGHVELEAARAALLASDDLLTATRVVATDPQPESPLGPGARLDDMLAFAASERYFEARERVGLATPKA